MVGKCKHHAVEALELIKKHSAPPMPLAAVLTMVVSDGGSCCSHAVRILSKIPAAAPTAHVHIFLNSLSLAYFHRDTHSPGHPTIL